MIDLPLEKISFSDIDQFVQQKWSEGKSIDYKRDAYGNRDEDKKELLKDVSSFANTIGGDILIGIDEDKGVPIGIPGIVLADVDKEKLRLEGIIRQGLEPRIDFGIHHVTLPSGSFVLIIRVKESLCFHTELCIRESSESFGAGVQRGSSQWIRTSYDEHLRCQIRYTKISERFAEIESTKS